MNGDRRDVRRARPINDHRAGYAEGQPTDEWGRHDEARAWPAGPWEGRAPFGENRGWPDEPRSWDTGDGRGRPNDPRAPHGWDPSEDRARWEAHTRRRPQDRMDPAEATRSGMMTPGFEGDPTPWARAAWSGSPPRPRGNPPRGYRRSDERITEDLSERLMDAGINGAGLEVAVKDGVVTLTGEVDRREDRYAAEHIAAGLSGVRDVENNLKVAKPAASPGEISAATTIRDRGSKPRPR